ncbi:hypothetical protein BDR05DRAFT_1006408 [Suillus weaverae]|nr:hypothetical protein BDR05DRAFT_1006408 [Suillus weaverae]
MYGAQHRPSGAPENQPTNEMNTNPYQFGSPAHDSNTSPYQFPSQLPPRTLLLNTGGHPLPQVHDFFSQPPQAEAAKPPAQEYRTPSNIMHPPSVTQNLVTPLFQGGTPYLGHSSCTPFSGSESSRSHTPSLGPGGDYSQLSGPAHHQPHMMPHIGFNCRPLYHDSVGYELQNSVSILTARMGSLEEVNQQLYQRMIMENEKLARELDLTVTLVKTLQTEIAQITMAPNQVPTGGEKTVRQNISNKHRALKGLLHPLFYDLCNVNSNLAKSKCIKLLCDVKPLETGKAFETDEDGRKIWFLKWQANVDDDVNTAFIQEVVTLMWNNEKGEIPDSAYKTGIISECAKAYFRNIHKQHKELNDAELGLKALARKTNSKHRSRRQAATNRRRKAAKAYENETGIQGVMAILDTDFASDILSYASDQELSEDMLERRKEAGVGEGADMVAGLQWRSPDFVAFGRWLTLKNKKDPDNVSTNEPAMKRRKVIKKKLTKNTFDLAPSKMSKDPPFASKKTVPFKSMIAKSWMEKYPDTVFLEGGE